MLDAGIKSRFQEVDEHKADIHVAIIVLDDNLLI